MAISGPCKMLYLFGILKNLMKVSYDDGDLEALCGQARIATKKLGDPSARKLQRRISELHAARVVGELVAGRPHPLKGDRVGEFTIDLHGGHRLIFRPTMEAPALKPDGSIDWAAVNEVTVVWVGDYHD